MRWVLPPPAGREVSFLDRLLEARGIGRGERDAFLRPRLSGLGDPLDLPDMGAAADRILGAVDARENTVIFGDYDVDGVTSVALLWEILSWYGLECACFLPRRMDEGYGLSEDGVRRCVGEHGPSLLIAVDCGTSSHGVVAGLRESGVDVVIVDHHECPERLPDCAALVNPKRGGGGHDFCTAGLVFKLGHALMKRRRLAGRDLRDLLDLVTIGTVSDLVPLRGENRILVRAGLGRVASSARAGVRALIEVSGVDGDPDVRDIGYRLGPRLNAAGRLDSAVDSLDLLRTGDPARARLLAGRLDLRNRERQSIERRIVIEAGEQVDGAGGPPSAALVVGSDDWHPGVLGIVASRLMRRHHRPTVAVGFGADGLGRGSGRSIPGISIVDVLRECADCLERYGGHEMAAGLSIRRERFDAFRSRFVAACARRATDELLTPTLDVDALLDPGRIHDGVLADLARIEPCGIGNPQPVLAALGVSPARAPRVLKERHLRLVFRGAERPVTAMWFNCDPALVPEPPWDIAYHLGWDTYRGRTSPRMTVLALRASVQ